MKPFKYALTFSFLLFFLISSAHASTYVPVEDDVVYQVLSRLEAEGVIQSALLDTKPISRKEAFRLLHEAEANSSASSELVGSLVQTLKDRLGPEPAGTQIKSLDTIYAKYVNTNAGVIPLVYGTAVEKEQAFNYNNDGDLYSRGSNYRAGFTSRIEDLGPLSFYINPEFRSSEGDQAVLRKGYGVLGFFSWIDIIAGKDSQWWGPGYNAANLISNNAEPLTMIKVNSPEPLRLPWIFKYLGPFQYTLFTARLEKDRIDFPEPYLNGIRLDFKPVPYVEIGLEKIQLLGGVGRPTTAQLWIESFIGVSSHPNIDTPDYTDSEAGADIKLTLPFKLQPLQIYWERDGEDAAQYKFGLPRKLEDLYGLYLPRLLGFERIGLRAEYAINHVRGWPNVWYTDSKYTAGMTYNGMIIGNDMGTDSRDAFLELSYYIPEKMTRLFLSYDQKTHNLSGPVQEITKETKLKAEIMLSKHIDFTGALGYGWIENPGNAPGPRLDVNAIAAEAQYRF